MKQNMNAIRNSVEIKHVGFKKKEFCIFSLIIYNYIHRFLETNHE